MTDTASLAKSPAPLTLFAWDTVHGWEACPNLFPFFWPSFTADPVAESERCIATGKKSPAILLRNFEDTGFWSGVYGDYRPWSALGYLTAYFSRFAASGVVPCLCAVDEERRYSYWASTPAQQDIIAPGGMWADRAKIIAWNQTVFNARNAALEAAIVVAAKTAYGLTDAKLFPICNDGDMRPATTIIDRNGWPQPYGGITRWQSPGLYMDADTDAEVTYNTAVMANCRKGSNKVIPWVSNPCYAGDNNPPSDGTRWDKMLDAIQGSFYGNMAFLWNASPPRPGEVSWINKRTGYVPPKQLPDDPVTGVPATPEKEA